MGFRKTFIEEGRQEGIREGLMKAVDLGLTLKFGKESLKMMEKVSRIKDVERLEAISELILTVNDVSEFRKRLDNQR